MAKVTEKLKLIGVDCPTCIYGIERSLTNVEGVLSFKADYVSGEAIIEYDNELCSLGNIVKAIRGAGYDVEKDYIELYTDLEGEESYTIESRVRKIPGVIECKVSPVTGTIRILYNPYTTSGDELK